MEKHSLDHNEHLKWFDTVPKGYDRFSRICLKKTKKGTFLYFFQKFHKNYSMTQNRLPFFFLWYHFINIKVLQENGSGFQRHHERARKMPKIVVLQPSVLTQNGRRKENMGFWPKITRLFLPKYYLGCNEPSQAVQYCSGGF